MGMWAAQRRCVYQIGAQLAARAKEQISDEAARRDFDLLMTQFFAGAAVHAWGLESRQLSKPRAESSYDGPRSVSKSLVEAVVGAARSGVDLVQLTRAFLPFCGRLRFPRQAAVRLVGLALAQCALWASSQPRLSYLLRRVLPDIVVSCRCVCRSCCCSPDVPRCMQESAPVVSMANTVLNSVAEPRLPPSVTKQLFLGLTQSFWGDLGRKSSAARLSRLVRLSAGGQPGADVALSEFGLAHPAELLTCRDDWLAAVGPDFWAHESTADLFRQLASTARRMRDQGKLKPLESQQQHAERFLKEDSRVLLWNSTDPDVSVPVRRSSLVSLACG